MSTSSAAAAHQPTSRSAEPSMEEILASIRRIISDDQKALDAKLPDAAPRQVAAPAAPVADDDSDEDVLDLELATESPAPAPPRIEEPRAPVFTAPPPREVPPPPPPAAPVASVRASEPEAPRLISDQVASATSNAFQSLANTVFAPNARTMDDLVRDMLRPMLKSWLDDNLPGLVERLVRAEIERVARGGR